MKLGCNTVLFNQLDLYGALQHISWAGYEGAEIACQEEWARHLELNTNQAYVDEINYIVKKHGLKLFAIQAAFPSLSEEEQVKAMTKVFDVAQKLTIPIVATRAFGKADDKEATTKEFNFLRKISEKAESRGITLAVKPHRGASVYNTATVLQMLEEIKSPALGVNFDALHLTKGGDNPAEAALKIGKHIVHVHCHDCPRPKPTNDTPEDQVPGRSMINWHAVLNNLKQAGYNGALDVHIVGAFTYPLSRQMGLAAEARGYLNRCLQEIQ